MVLDSHCRKWSETCDFETSTFDAGRLLRHDADGFENGAEPIAECCIGMVAANGGETLGSKCAIMSISQFVICSSDKQFRVACLENRLLKLLPGGIGRNEPLRIDEL